ncbi:hypothetical protein AVEN_41426-1 [Araneus ventricosus]|uniref:SHSP domain-containing protein n=1 Tax=Araneus ventricosus TaxID=182803 RepID=A0A4Y2WXN6_ARAVE|nr:hypothetical protein AVEN_31564-1 [Araneus ventricosus]GBO41280.1 hypothetical protein AVEN_103339-1 [Araneus ventricosus]GBO41813.1 hypothetical protein AVEN_4965-1 [Araneus ventricosus]GBO41821.1 hypothetical protein AVEN_41426-1 [Araneus ventricosus]
MAYEFGEIKFLKDEGADWWETIKKVPIKLVDQDFGVEVPISDLTDSTADEKPKEADDPSSTSKDEQDVSEKVLDLDSFKRKEDAVKNPGYSKVTFDKGYFGAEIFSNQFGNRDFHVKISKGFLIIDACRSSSTEGDGTVWRKFERRYMLPHDCHVSDVLDQLTIEYIEGGIKVNVLKYNPDDSKRSPGKHPALKPAGKSPLKSPPKEKEVPSKKA